MTLVYLCHLKASKLEFSKKKCDLEANSLTNLRFYEICGFTKLPLFVCVYTPKQTFELIYIRLKPQAHVRQSHAHVSKSPASDRKIVYTWFVN